MEILIDDASPQFEYVSAGQQPQGISGTWHNAYQSEDRDTQLFHRGTVYRSTGEGNQFIAHLNASSVRVFGSFYNNHGVFGAAIDGGQEVEKDGYTANRTMNAELASFDNLDSGRPHVLTLTNHPSRNERPDDARASQGWLDIDYLLLRHDVDGQIRTTRHGSDATAFQYTGDWQAGDAGARRSTKAGAAATLSFTGRSVQLFGSLGAEFGEYSIFLDGVEAYRRFNASMHVGIPDVALYTASGLEDGPHRLQIVNQGASGRDATIAVNYAIVNTTLPQDAPLSPVGGTTSSIAASGTSIVGMNPTSDSSSTSSMSSTLASLSTTATTGLITDTSTKGADPNFVYPPSHDTANDASQGSHAPASGVIAGIVLGAAFLLGAILLAAWYLRRRLDWRERNIHAWTVATSPHPSQYDDKPTPTGSFRSAHKFYHRRESGASYSSRTAFPLLQVTNPSPAEGSGTESFRSRWSSIFAFGRPGRRGSSVSASVVPSSAAVGRWHRRGESELDGGTTDGWERMRDRSERASKASNPFTFDGMSEVQPPPTAMSRHPDALFFDVAMSGRQSAISAQASPMPMPRPRSPRVTTSSGSSNARLAYL